MGITGVNGVDLGFRAALAETVRQNGAGQLNPTDNNPDIHGSHNGAGGTDRGEAAYVRNWVAQMYGSVTGVGLRLNVQF